MKIYLCGPINGCTDAEASDWREFMKERLFQHEHIDPMKRDYRGKEAVAYREIVDLDKADVRAADVILVNYDKPSVGTAMEVFYAWDLGKPVIVWCRADAVISPWLRYHSTCFVHSMAEVIAAIERCSPSAKEPKP
jgi:nucleoside 2-deoxyribosyltransferase